jgi:uncharacterized radical SAM protein YgiQ
MFIPTTTKELKKLGWKQCDVILITGDTYIDSPHIGIALLGKLLIKTGYKVGIIAQPDISGDEITRLDEPRLFWGVTAGSVDSLIANYTATNKFRKSDDYTPGGINNRRPDRASIVYSNLIRRYFKFTVPIVLGGIEASLRRIAHYDFWSNKLRRSILFDAKADYLVYGMAEKTIIEFAQSLEKGDDPHKIRGLSYISKTPPEAYKTLPSYQTVVKNKWAFIDMFHTFYRNNDPLNAKGLVQKTDERYLVQNPPQFYLSQAELDRSYALDFERAVHPYYLKQGNVRALDTINFSISSHRGCYGECNFCAIGVHEGRTIRWRSEQSIIKEAKQMTTLPDFTGYISDVGGPTANMYGFECAKKLKSGACKNKRCIYPDICPQLPITHKPQIKLLQRIRNIPGVKKVFIGSGIRTDLMIADRKQGLKYLKEVVKHHTSGQLKIAPEHTEPKVLAAMGKPDRNSLMQFKKEFDNLTRSIGKKQFLTYYFIAAHPGCTETDMEKLKSFVSRELCLNPEQIQIYTPTPSTYSSLMYYTGMDPFTMKNIFVEKKLSHKEKQKNILLLKEKSPTQKRMKRNGRKTTR